MKCRKRNKLFEIFHSLFHTSVTSTLTLVSSLVSTTIILSTGQGCGREGQRTQHVASGWGGGGGWRGEGGAVCWGWTRRAACWGWTRRAGGWLRSHGSPPSVHLREKYLLINISSLSNHISCLLIVHYWQKCPQPNPYPITKTIIPSRRVCLIFWSQ